MQADPRQEDGRRLTDDEHDDVVRLDGATSMDELSLTMRGVVGDALHRAAHPHHPWSGCAYPDLWYDRTDQFLSRLSRVGIALRFGPPPMTPPDPTPRTEAEAAAPVDPGEDVVERIASAKAAIEHELSLANEDDPFEAGCSAAYNFALSQDIFAGSVPVDRVGGEGLDEAWKEAEAALPEGWWIEKVYLRERGTRLETYSAWARRPDADGGLRGDGDTPTAALRALATTLAVYLAALVNDETEPAPSEDPS